MKKHSNSAIAATFALAMAFSLIPPAQAQNFQSILRNALGGGGGNGFVNPNQAMIQSNIDTGLANMSNDVNVKLRGGDISSIQANALRDEINRMSSMRDSFMGDGVLSNAEVQQMLSAFTNFNTMMTGAVSVGPNSTGAQVGYGDRFGDRYGDRFGSRSYNRVYRRGDGGFINPSFGSGATVASYRAQVGARLDQAIANRTLSGYQARQFRDEFNELNTRVSGRRFLRRDPNSDPDVQQLISLDRRLQRMVAARGYRPYY